MAQESAAMRADLLAFKESRNNEDGQLAHKSVLLRGIPIVTQAQVSVLTRHLTRKLGEHGQIQSSPEQIYMPMDASGTSKGYAFCEFVSADAATGVVTNMNGHVIDMQHTMGVERVVDYEGNSAGAV